MVYKTNLKLGFVVVRCWIVCVWLVGVYSVIIEFIYTHLEKKPVGKQKIAFLFVSFHVEVYSNSYYYVSEIPNKKMQFWHNAAVENQKDYCIFVLVSNENSYVLFVQAILNNQSASITLRLMNCALCTERILSA